MRQFVPCNGCGSQVPTPEILEGNPIPQFLTCESCGNEFFWDGGLTDNCEPLILFSVEDTAENSDAMDSTPKLDQGYLEQNDVDSPHSAATESFELELEIEIEPESESQSASEEHNLPTGEVSAHLEESEVPREPFFDDQDDYGQEFPAPELAEPIAPEPMEQETSVDWGVLEPTTLRRRPKEASAIRKIIPPILGGLAAFPIAMIILWYGMGKDIGVGPIVAKYVPWIVPEKFRDMPYELAPPKLSSERSQSAPSVRNTLPSLSSDETTELPNDQSDVDAPIIAMEKPIVEPEPPISSPELKSTSASELSNSSISETKMALRLLQKELSDAPQKDRPAKFAECLTKLRQLSQQSADLKGPSARIWHKEVEAIAKEILADPFIPKAMKAIANKSYDKIPVTTSIAGDFVATVIDLGPINEPSPDAIWLLHEKWPSDKAQIPIEVLPGAWRASSATLPATCLVLGRLLPAEGSDKDTSNNGEPGSKLVLKVHLLLPQP